jgi:hypothetical protein
MPDRGRIVNREALWHRRPGRRVAVFLGLLFAGLGGLQKLALSASPAQSLEYDVKAAFLLNFTRFIDWPASEATGTDSPFTICVFGEDPFGPILDQTMQGELVNGRKIVVERVGNSVARACQILYLNRAEKGVREILSGVGTGVLTVGEGDGFIGEGGMIAFVLDNRRVRFNINLTASRNGMLTLSSRLLAVARSVER